MERVGRSQDGFGFKVLRGAPDDEVDEVGECCVDGVELREDDGRRCRSDASEVVVFMGGKRVCEEAGLLSVRGCEPVEVLRLA